MSETRTHAEILTAAKARIADQRHFVMGALAWDRNGRLVDATSPDAWRWNPQGAIYAESDTRTEADRAYQLIDRAAWEVATEQGWHFPAGTDVADNLGHALALEMFDRAIALASADAEAI
jgi:hypothetical protein